MVSFHYKIPYVSKTLTLYENLIKKLNLKNTILLESADIQSRENTKSIVLLKASLKLVCKGREVEIKAQSKEDIPLLNYIKDKAKDYIKSYEEDTLLLYFPKSNKVLDEKTKLLDTSPLDALRIILKSLSKGEFDTFLAGAFAFDYICNFEDLPKLEKNLNTMDDFVFYLAKNLLLINHEDKTSQIIVNGFKKPKKELKKEAKQLAKLCEIQSKFKPKYQKAKKVYKKSVEDKEFCDTVEFLQEKLKLGEIFQVVPSRSFTLECKEPLSAYYFLKKSNPSPYMFYMQDEDFTLFGASPESALKYNAKTNTASVYPIAGTKARGKDKNGNLDLDLDSRIELQLLSDEKERAEHLMLVDLARNDLARIAKINTRFVSKLLSVDKYSNVMHLVSEVDCKLDKPFDALHAYSSFMNAGTLTGAPKVQALKLISQVEKVRRGSYGGAVGYLMGTGDMDTCITIRSCFVKDDLAVVQAGAGVVMDSVPILEAQETINKAQALISAIFQSYKDEK